MKINRTKLLGCLQSVEAGLTTKEQNEQSDCFVFQNEILTTFNEEIACQKINTPLKDIDGAILAKPILALLNAWTTEEINIDVKDNKLRLWNHNKRASLAMQEEILMPISSLEYSEKWIDIPEGFLDALILACSCVAKNDDRFELSCVHIHPNWIEASDNEQIIKYKINTGLSESCIVQGSSIKRVLHTCEFNQMSVSKSWLHFQRNDLVISCRRYNDEYPQLDEFYECDGHEVFLPKELVPAVESASILSEEFMDGKKVKVTLKDNEVIVKGEGPQGWYEEAQTVEYDGKPITFQIAPKLLTDITQKTDKCLIGSDKIKIEHENFQYVACLEKVE